MARGKPGRRGKTKPAARTTTRLGPVLVVTAILCAAGVLIILSTRQQSITPHGPEAPVRQATETAPPIDLAGMTVEQQVATLREEATKLAEDLAARFPNEVEAHVLLGDVHRRFGRSEEAMSCWRSATELDARQASPYDRMAIVAMEKGQFDEALNLWRKVLALAPGSADIHDKMGRVFMASGRQDEAIAALTEAVRLSPRSALTSYLLGQAYLQKKDYEQAVGWYEKALALDPNLANAHYGLATAYARLRRPALAKQYQATFKTVSASGAEDSPYGYSAADDLRRAREDYIGPALRGATLLKAKGQMSGAEALLRRAVSVDPNEVDCRRRLAAFYQGVGQLSKALAQCECVARLAPEDPTCQLLIGSLALRLKLPARAEAAYKRCTVLAPGQSAGYRELAGFYLGTGQKTAEARGLAEKAVALEPIALNYFVLSQACYQAGDMEGALAAMGKAMQLDPGNRRYQQAYNMIKTRR